MPMSMPDSVSGGPCVASADEAGTALQLSLGLRRLGLGAPLPVTGGCGGLSDGCRLDLTGFQDALRESRRSCNMTECVSVPSSEHVAEIVGRQGCKIKALRAKTNTYIKTPVRGEEPVFVVTGRRDDVMSAKREILSAAEHFSQIRASRRSGAAGGSGAGLSAAAAHSGGSLLCSSASAATSLGVACSPISATSSATAAQSAAGVPGQVTAMVRVPYRVVGLVVGPKGATIKRIQQATGTYIVTPSRDKDPVFEVTGLPESVEKARAEIERHIASRAGGETTPAVGMLSSCGGAAATRAAATGCFHEGIGCGGASYLGFGGSSSRCCCGTAGPCRDPACAGSGFLYSSLAATAKQHAALDLGGLGRIDDGTSEDGILSARCGSGEGDSGCSASMGSDIECGGVKLSTPSSAASGTPAAMRLPFSTSSIWSDPVSCGGASARASAAAALSDDSLGLSPFSADRRRRLALGCSVPRRRSAGAGQSPPTAAAVGDPCADDGCRRSLSLRRGQEASDCGAAQHAAACGFASSAVAGAFPASSSSSSGCSSTSTSPVVERRQRGGGSSSGSATSPCFGCGASVMEDGSYFVGGGDLQSFCGSRLLGGGGGSEDGCGSRCGASFTAAVASSATASSYPWCYGLDHAAAAFDERLCGSF